MNRSKSLVFTLSCLAGWAWASDVCAADAAGVSPAEVAAAASATSPRAPAPLEASDPVLTKGGEPAIKHTVIDDKSAHIDELRVRGQLQSVTVRPKGVAPEYEVLTGSDARNLPEEGKNQSSGLAGKRVWSLLRF